MSAIPTPTWHSSNLKKHYAKHHTCFEALLGLTNGVISEKQYMYRAQQAIANSWLEYECESREVNSGSFNPLRVTYVDTDLVLSITDAKRQTMVTSHHEHFDDRQCAGRGHGIQVGDRKIKYRRKLFNDERGGSVRKLRRVRDA